MKIQLTKYESKDTGSQYSHLSAESFLRVALKRVVFQHHGQKNIFVIGATDNMLNFLCDSYPDAQIVIGQIPTLHQLGAINQDGRFRCVTIAPASLPFPDDTFDVVICSEAFSQLPEYRNLLRELLRVLKPGMPLIVTTHRTAMWNLFPKKDGQLRTFTTGELATLFQDFHMTRVHTSGMFSRGSAVFGKKHLLQVKHSGVVHLPSFEDSRGGMLLTAEFGKTVPFDAKRIYVISNISGKDAVRGDHVHKTLDQVIFCVSGSFVLRIDDGVVHQKIKMKNNGYGIRLGPKLWHSMRKFSSDCVILVLASDFYDESDYIRKYEDFRSYIAQNP